MKRCLRYPALLLFILSAVNFSDPQAQTRRAAQQRGEVCADPTQKCQTFATFEPYDLPFRIKENSVIWESEFFYAVILKSIRAADGNCEQFIPENERLSAQALFPRRKVFASRCAEPASLFYTNTGDNHRFMAVYAGATRAEAARVLETVKATGKFPGANIRRMRAGFNGT
jgi:hypothetical protein